MKTDKSLDILIAKAHKEIFQFSYNKYLYSVDDLVKYGLSSKIPHLIKLNKQVEKVSITNLAGYPLLHVKFKTNKKSKSLSS